jgi:hypothetical protein
MPQYPSIKTGTGSKSNTKKNRTVPEDGCNWVADTAAADFSPRFFITEACACRLDTEVSRKERKRQNGKGSYERKKIIQVLPCRLCASFPLRLCVRTYFRETPHVVRLERFPRFSSAGMDFHAHKPNAG